MTVVSDESGVEDEATGTKPPSTGCLSPRARVQDMADRVGGTIVNDVGDEMLKGSGIVAKGEGHNKALVV